MLAPTSSVNFLTFTTKVPRYQTEYQYTHLVQSQLVALVMIDDYLLSTYSIIEDCVLQWFLLDFPSSDGEKDVAKTPAVQSCMIQVWGSTNLDGLGDFSSIDFIDHHDPKFQTIAADQHLIKGIMSPSSRHLLCSDGPHSIIHLPSVPH